METVSENLVQNETHSTEMRADRRRRVLKGGNLYFNKGYGAYQCTVRNLSDGGALIEMEDSSGLPSSFDFLISGEAKPVTASIAWRLRGKAGLKFL